jgi:hypothetical protein
MKRRLSSFAVVVVLADVLVLGAAWHVVPALTLAAALAVPHVELLMAPLYAEAVREDVVVDVAGASLRADLYRPARPRSAVVLVDDSHARTWETDIIRLARAISRRDIAVLVPQLSPTLTRSCEDEGRALEAALAYTRKLGVPVEITSVATLRLGAEPSSIAARAAYASRLFRLTSALLAGR